MILSREYNENWSNIEKLVFRFLFSYFTLYIFGIFMSGLWKPLVVWVAKSILNIQYDFIQNGFGSGDTTFQYVLTFTYLIVSIVATIIWFLVDYKRKSYNNLNYGFLVLLRFILIYFMLIYGLIKVFHLQMIPPTYSKLMQPLGEMSPMGLAWTFMGYSKGYSMFAGGIEVLAGVLLIPRRTVTIGALIAVGVMTQVFIMNLSFDIPVKLFSFHLLLMGSILFLANSKRFVNSILLGKGVEKELQYPVLKNDEKQIINVVKISLFSILILFIGFAQIARVKEKMKALNTPFAGVWEVTSFKKNGNKNTKDYIHKKDWKYIIIDTEKSLSIQQFDDSILRFYIAIDTIDNKISFKQKKEDNENWFNYEKIEKKLYLKGILNDDTLQIKLNQKTKNDFLLTNRSFNWINEKPFNK